MSLRLFIYFTMSNQLVIFCSVELDTVRRFSVMGVEKVYHNIAWRTITIHRIVRKSYHRSGFEPYTPWMPVNRITAVYTCSICT